MDFDTRQKAASAEIEALLKKYGLGIEAVLKYDNRALVPLVRLIDLNKTDEDTKDTNPKKKGKKGK